ncbi:MAG: hypothetical protein PHO57_09915 [Acidithiobacillus sp.]|nr:hypothetical protein [Acidithiobacillus sp.]
MNETERAAVRQLFASLPALDGAELTLGGTRYRCTRSGPWVLIDRKKAGRGWEMLTECKPDAVNRRKGA